MQRIPFTPEELEIVDREWLSGTPAMAIARLCEFSDKRIRGALHILGHEYQSRHVKYGVPTWTPEKQREYKSRYDRDRLIEYKRQVFNHYGARCSCCGEDTIQFLTIDHINDDGAEDARTRTQATLYEAVVKRGFPTTFRILCLNCNRGRWLNGGTCPHETPAWTGFLLEGVG